MFVCSGLGVRHNTQRAANCHYMYIYIYVRVSLPDDPSSVRSARFQISFREVYEAGCLRLAVSVSRGARERYLSRRIRL